MRKLAETYYEKPLAKVGAKISQKSKIIIIIKENIDFALLVDHRVKIKESENRDKCQDLAWELKRTPEYEGNSDTNFHSCARNSNYMFGKVNRRPRSQRRTQDNPDESIVMNGHNNEKIPTD